MPDSVSYSEISDDWIASHREAIQRYGRPVRASVQGNSIEVKSLRPDNAWMVLELPRSQREFVTAQVRDQVLERLVGRSGAYHSPHGV